MTEMSGSERNFEVARQRQERYDAFFLGLTFAILGLSVQTAPDSGALAAATIEIGAWLSLLVSGVAGLARARRVPYVYLAGAGQATAEETKHRLAAGVLAGVRQVQVPGEARLEPIEKHVEMAKQAKTKADKLLSKEERITKRFDLAQRIGFLVGLSGLVISRGWETVSKLVQLLFG